MDFKTTLNLPDQEFAIPMKADLAKREPSLLEYWEKVSIYDRWLEARAGDPTFVLHDGPPYTNSPIHIGTAFNKILKDFSLKSRAMLGFRTPYVPGFDNHGLPIEQAVMKKFQEKGETPTTVELRKACREHAKNYIGVQTEQFKRMGVFGMWDRPYTTMDYRFEAEIIRVFKRLVERDFIYKGLRPTLWSPTSRTALADTEIIYKEHTSIAIHVRFPLRSDPQKVLEQFSSVYTIIWTTTPWTIPANLAVAFHPQFTYSVVKVQNDHYVVLKDLVEKVAEKCGWTDYSEVETFDGITLDGCAFKHPIFDRDSIAVMAEYVTTEDGTGVVHTAPGHGRDDFYTGQKYRLPILCPVDERGVLTAEAGEFEGIFYKKCDEVVVTRLREVGALLHSEPYVHQYPYAERDEQPVIFRATEQWYVGLDRNNLRQEMLDQIKGVKWYPPQGQSRIQAMVSGRPDWCISRQRPWGVGIPVFYGAKTRTPVLDPVAIEAVAKLVEAQGSDAWFEVSAEDILPKGYAHPETGETEFVKETDVLDVWFDSGSTSLAVLEGNVEPRWKEEWPATVYFEGSDQHRGWFNSSLIIGTAIKGRAPYREVVTHGFVNDDQGRKMSKRLGNVVDPIAASEQYGADIIRYWTASVDYTNDVPCSDALLKVFGEQYRKVRNTLRYLMSNLYDYPGSFQGVLTDVDEWILEQVDLLVADCVDAYKSYEFARVVHSVHDFCVNELSSFYMEAIKDPLYCHHKDHPERRSAQFACQRVLVQLNRLIAPILCFTAEEVRQKLNPDDGLVSVHQERLEIPTNERLADIEASTIQVKFASLLEARSEAFAALEVWKAENQVKNSQHVILTMTTQSKELQEFSADELANYFKMSWVELSEGEPSYSFRKSEYLECARCRLLRPDVEMVDGVPLAKRCQEVMAALV